MSDFSIDEIKRRMDGALASLKSEFQGLRTGRANINLLDPIMVDAYGSTVPLNQVASVSAPEPRMLVVTVWDKGTVVSVEKAIRNSGLGLNPIVDGMSLRLPIPPLNEERRRDLVKLAAKYAEAARVAIRNVRRDGMDMLKKNEKDGKISEDEHKKLSLNVQEATDSFVKQADALLKTKEERDYAGLRWDASNLMIQKKMKRVKGKCLHTLRLLWMVMGAGQRRAICHEFLVIMQVSKL